MREQRWIFLGMFGALFLGCLAFAYSAWGDAGDHTRFQAKVAFVAIVCVGTPTVTTLMVRAVRTRRMGKRWSASTRGWMVATGVVLAPVVEHASWQLVFFAAFAALVLAYTVGMSAVFLMLSPEEDIARRREAGLLD